MTRRRKIAIALVTLFVAALVAVLLWPRGEEPVVDDGLRLTILGSEPIGPAGLEVRASAPGAAEGSRYFVLSQAQGEALYVTDGSDAGTRLIHASSGTISAPVLVGSDAHFLDTPADGPPVLYRVEGTGIVSVRSGIGLSTIMAAGDVLYYVEAGALFEIDAPGGAESRLAALESPVVSWTAGFGGQLYLATAAGKLYEAGPGSGFSPIATAALVKRVAWTGGVVMLIGSGNTLEVIGAVGRAPELYAMPGRMTVSNLLVLDGITYFTGSPAAGGDPLLFRLGSSNGILGLTSDVRPGDWNLQVYADPEDAAIYYALPTLETDEQGARREGGTLHRVAVNESGNAAIAAWERGRGLHGLHPSSIGAYLVTAAAATGDYLLYFLRSGDATLTAIELPLGSRTTGGELHGAALGYAVYLSHADRGLYRLVAETAVLVPGSDGEIVHAETIGTRLFVVIETDAGPRFGTLVDDAGGE